MLSVTPAKSYLGPSFDRCEACSDVALDAIVQSVLYVLARAVPDALGQTEVAHLGYRLRVRLEGEDGQEIAVDEVEADQDVSVEPAPDEWDVQPLDLAESPEPRTEEAVAAPSAPRAHAALDDFQAMIDRVVLVPRSPTEVSGSITGRLFGFERLIGPFEVLVSPC